MKKKPIHSPIEILKKIDYNITFEIDKMKILNSPVEPYDEDVMESSLNIYLYAVASLIENKNVYPKNNSFDFNDFITDFKDLMLAFKIFYKSSLFDLVFTTPFNIINANNFKFSILLKNIILYYKLQNRIDNKVNCPIIIKKFEEIGKIMDEFTHSDFNKVIYNINAYQPYAYDYMNKLLNKDTLEIFQYISNINSFLYNYLNNVDSNFSYYRIDNEKYSVERVEEIELSVLEKHLEHIGVDKNFSKKLLKITKERVINKNAKTIISSLPAHDTIYENPISIFNIIGRINSIDIEQNHLLELNKLYDIHPHFEEVIDYLILSLKSNLRNSKILKFKPILLVGPNGIGKTSFLMDVSKIFNMSNNFINYGSLTTPTEICGLTSMWRTGQLGFVSKAININNVYNPIIILEEIDKTVKSSHNGNVYAPLYDLLEKRTSEMFFDNYLGVSLNMSHVNFLATANKLSNIDFGISNRFRIFNINHPEDKDIFDIVNSIYNNLIKEDIFDIVRIEKDGLRSIANSCISHKLKNIRAISKMIEDILMEGIENHEGNDVFIIDYISDAYLNKNSTLH